MNKEIKSVSPFQLFFIILQAQVGVGLLSLPFSVHAYSKQDSWISVIIAGAVIQGFIIVIAMLCKRFPTMTVFEIAPFLFGKLAGKALNMMYLIYFLAVALLIALLSVGVIKDWILAYTPDWILYVLIMSSALYLARENIRIIARFTGLVTIFIVFFILFYLMGLTNVNYRYLFPMAHTNYVDLLKGAHASIVSMLGFEILLVIFPYINGKSGKVLKVSLIASGFTTLLYVFFMVITLMYFSPAEIEVIPEPVLYLLKSLVYQSIERLDLIFLSFWLITMITSIVVYIYLASKCLSVFLFKGSHKKTSPIICGTIFVFTLFIKNEDVIQVFSKYVSLSSYVFTFVFPFLLLIVSILFKKKVASLNE
ncbi:GerAB/ArcD/ProY family transporter [Falsibacillus pallidus]|uniref:GerAB/ArcD/ProY family transporter n=1 Tax=Falsibacillus pallidus TaxID=493781 RepID=UPI003D975E8F